jgi:glycosyltransferase involved in cell wall biosynthesis
MNILAVVAVRNEVLHISRCINCLIDNGFEVALIDHASTDGTKEIAESYLGNGLVRICNLPWEGHFSLERQLLEKSRIIDNSSHEWVAHFDADEWPMPNPSFINLNEMAGDADSSGYNVINFNEFTFIPAQGVACDFSGYETEMKHYYFFQPRYPRLQRMWRRDSRLTNLAGGGHTLSSGSVKQYPLDGALRHYIVLNEEQAVNKYTNRIFADADLGRGWHRNRLAITEGKIRKFFKTISQSSDRIKILKNVMSSRFDTSSPQNMHFWDWPS